MFNACMAQLISDMDQTDKDLQIWVVDAITADPDKTQRLFRAMLCMSREEIIDLDENDLRRIGRMAALWLYHYTEKVLTQEDI